MVLTHADAMRSERLFIDMMGEAAPAIYFFVIFTIIFSNV